uniref:Serpin B10 n=1 Tax=Sphenodon punctatus TaxID=8508 RepID=A0A8D0HKT2_SPHPU
MDSLAVSTGNFTLDLFQKLNESAKGTNIFFSPWSIASALAMVYVGAKGNTATQMAEMKKSCPSPQHSRVMESDQGKDEDVHRGFLALISEINKPRSTYVLRTANRLYGEKTFHFLTEYIQLVKKYYRAEPQSVNFLKAAEQVRKEINSWVESQTESKIQNLLPKGAVSSDTALVLVNAIYFKGKWAKRFPKENTTEQPFRLSKTKTKPVQMMFLKDVFLVNYIEALRTKVVTLPYISNDLSMFILLPDDINDKSTGLELLERELTYEKLSQWTSLENMGKAEVELHLPRIKLEESYDLKSTLSNMGMKDAFSKNQADFTGMSEKNDLFLSQVFHKTFVEVNEEGTEAAASTAAVVVVRSLLSFDKFKADHPFLFFIIHNKTKNILFFGRFCSP